ncbi:MAG: hypothetical protein Q7T54_06100 [Candidatus Levybacteria bacterium]|nr:hypothetical protein [Candidatus Levybacteria bacterium]
MQDINPLLVIYKNKILLTCSDRPYDEEVWSFIGEQKTGSKSPDENVKKELKHITKLGNEVIEGSIMPSPFNESIFYVRLTDKNVNSIVRREGQRLEFYALNEIEKLPLSSIALTLFKEFKAEISTLAQG